MYDILSTYTHKHTYIHTYICIYLPVRLSFPFFPMYNVSEFRNKEQYLCAKNKRKKSPINFNSSILGVLGKHNKKVLSPIDNRKDVAFFYQFRSTFGKHTQVDRCSLILLEGGGGEREREKTTDRQRNKNRKKNRTRECVCVLLLSLVGKYTTK